MLIGELSKKTGITVRMLRFYEEKGLLKPNRSLNHYRIYTEQDTQTIETIIFFKQLGFTIKEIISLINCYSIHKDKILKIDKNNICPHLKERIFKKLIEINQKRTQLSAFMVALEQLI